MLEKMIDVGVDILRLNFSHGDFAEHEPKVILGRQAAQKLGLPVAILQDLGGPKIRIGDFTDPEGIELIPGQIFTVARISILRNDLRRV
jgi:pyruvate kinase